MVGCRLSEKPEASLGREHSAPNTIWLQLQDFHLFSFFFFFLGFLYMILFLRKLYQGPVK